MRLTTKSSAGFKTMREKGISREYSPEVNNQDNGFGSKTQRSFYNSLNGSKFVFKSIAKDSCPSMTKLEPFDKNPGRNPLYFRNASSSIFF